MPCVLPPRRFAVLFLASCLPLAALFAPAQPTWAAVPTTPPAISGFSPVQGPVGSTVVITGSNFRTPLIVTFAGDAIANSDLSGDQLTVTVPSGAQTGLIKVTNSAGSVSTASNFTVGVALPTVTLTATISPVAVGGGTPGLFTLGLAAPLGTDLTVNYYATGSAREGTDYVSLKGTAKIKAGHTSKSIKIAPMGNLGGAAKKTVKLTLLPGMGYTVSTATPQKVKIVAEP